MAEYYLKQKALKEINFYVFTEAMTHSFFFKFFTIL